MCYTSFVGHFSWDAEKNKKLKAERHVSFGDVIYSIENGLLLDIVDHSNTEKYPHQCVLVVQINQYVYLVPFVEDGKGLFLKTIIPSRKAAKKYLRGGEVND